jgi:hypothetical protein
MQNTTLAAHAKELSELKSRLQMLEQRMFDHKLTSE